jgi:hypothetical protein
MLDKVRTKITAILIPKALNAVVLTASVGHNPNIKTNTGLFLIIPSTKCLPG